MGAPLTCVKGKSRKRNAKRNGEPFSGSKWARRRLEMEGSLSPCAPPKYFHFCASKLASVALWLALESCR